MRRAISLSLFVLAVAAYSSSTFPVYADADTGLTLTIVSRGPVLNPFSNSGHGISFFGHAFLIVGVKTSSGIKEEMFGFYPTSGGKGVIKGTGMLKAEYRCGPSDDCSETGRQHLLYRLSESNASVTVPITVAERRTIYQVIYRWDQHSRIENDVQIVPQSTKDYNLINQNCIDFLDHVLTSLGYRTPARSALQTPTEFVQQLKPFIQEQVAARRASEESKERAGE